MNPYSKLSMQTLFFYALFPFQQHGFIERIPPGYGHRDHRQLHSPWKKVHSQATVPPGMGQTPRKPCTAPLSPLTVIISGHFIHMPAVAQGLVRSSSNKNFGSSIPVFPIHSSVTSSFLHQHGLNKLLKEWECEECRMSNTCRCCSVSLL